MYKKLTIRRSNEEMTYNDVVRKLLGLGYGGPRKLDSGTTIGLLGDPISGKMSDEPQLDSCWDGDAIVRNRSSDTTPPLSKTLTEVRPRETCRNGQFPKSRSFYPVDLLLQEWDSVLRRTKWGIAVH